ncbi:HAD family hydrolase [Amnibacterium flavum]|uniref:HAD family hydrolase n=1 Tax=Amnibacterium flavum TaxID=2173173 RepID=UPI0014041837|nr:HAD family hydrolase [Amnibacterium flavum]
MDLVKPRLVLFDLDDTLFRHREAVEAAAAASLTALDPAASESRTAEEVGRWHELEEHHYHRYLSGELDYLGQRRARARDFVEPYGIDLADDREAEAWFEGYLTGYRAAWTLHDDALPCLDDLEEAFPGVRFGIITNGDLDFQLDKIDTVRLAPRIEHVIASGALGVTKPDPAIFRHACEVFDIAPSDSVYIGDRLRTDAIGAARAGLTGVWLDRRGITPPSDDAAEAEALGIVEITRLLDLVGALR